MRCTYYMARHVVLWVMMGLLCSFGKLHAQGGDTAVNPKFVKNDFGLGIGYNYFPGLGQEKDVYRFYIMKQFYEADNVFRLGLDLRVDPNTTYKFYFSGYYIGYARTVPLMKYRLWPYAGADFLIQQDVDGYNGYERWQSRFGLAPIGGLQYRIRPWLSFATELSYAFSLHETALKTYSGTSPVVKDRKYDFNINPHRLFSLGLNFHF